ncbi:hypothetical protein L3Q82_008637, partial [Scortum barcoo]
CSPLSCSLIMREQTLPRIKSQTGLLSGMLKRTKYSRLRNDSLTSLEDLPQRLLPLKRDLCLDSDFAQLDPGTPTQNGPSTLRDFIPRVTNIRLQSPISLQGLGGQTDTAEDRTIDEHTDRPLSRAEWGSGPNQKFCSQPFLSAPLSMGQKLTHSALRCTKRPITLHRMASLPWTPSCPPCSQHRDSLCCLKTSSAVDDCTVVRTATRVVHHHIKKIAHHPMQAISFASGGDPDMADYIAYVAKDLVNQRACHILECPHGRAGEVINSIGQAFETRFRQLLSHTPSLLSSSPRLSFCLVCLSFWSPVRLCHKWSPEETIPDRKAKQEGEISEHSDYYNVIPGKTPPPGGIEDLRLTREENKQGADIQGVCWSPPVSLYENCSITDETPAPPTDSEDSEVSAEQCTPPSETPIQDLIQKEGWYHGRLGREQAESLLTCSGDFLVRESSSASGQYVLSGMEGATVRHLLLVDPHGQVRTRDQVFLSVGHLVRFHMENQMPIISGSSELCLKQPVLQRH